MKRRILATALAICVSLASCKQVTTETSVLPAESNPGVEAFRAERDEVEETTEETTESVTTGTTESVADTTEQCRQMIVDMIIDYGTYRDTGRIYQSLQDLRSLDNDLASRWETVFCLWDEVDYMTVNPGVLPDGLSDDDRLCLVVLGFALNPDGTMRDELIGRLQVALRSAEKYPDSYIVCTGGGTALNNPSATEADCMAAWLIDQGVDPDRVIVENRSLSTAANAINTYHILREQYPEVTELAIITSGYHMSTGILAFRTEAILEAEHEGCPVISVVSNATYEGTPRTLPDMFQAGALIELAGDPETAARYY